MRHANRLLLLLAALTALVLTAAAGVALTPAAHAAGVQDRVGAFIPGTQPLTRPAAPESTCTRPGLIASAAGMTAGFCVAAEDGENSIERIYEPNPKHGPEPYIDSQGRVVSKAPTNGQGALDNSFQIKPTSPTRQGIDPDTGETVILPRHLVQNLPGGTVEYYHGYVP